MGDLLKDLGINYQAIIVQVIGLLIVLFILWKFLFGKLGGLLENRRNEIADRVESLENQQQELDRLKAEAQQRLNEIEAESQAKIQAAIDDATVERGQIIEQTRREAAQIIADASEEIQRQKDVAIGELRSTVADLAIAAAGKILEVELDEERHRKLIDAQVELIS